MGESLELAFFKMEGCGNDYVYLDMDLFPSGQRSIIEEHVEDLARKISDRHRGVGGDGLVLVTREGDEGGRMKMFNADGSESGICGNALRCVAKYLAASLTKQAEDPIAHDPIDSIDIHTGSGIKKCRLTWEGEVVTQVQADMGDPIFSASDIPFDPATLPTGALLLGGGGNTPITLELPLAEETLSAYVLSMGNPHLVVFVDGDPNDYDLAAFAAPLASAIMFPESANIELAQSLGPGRVRQRTFERGSGETLACGSGACAVGVAAVAHGLLSRGRPLQVDLLGGTLQIEWSPPGPVFMTGPATHVFNGSYRYEF